jgi:HAD superfamily hydrolase (TIGR01509 family)
LLREFSHYEQHRGKCNPRRFTPCATARSCVRFFAVLDIVAGRRLPFVVGQGVEIWPLHPLSSSLPSRWKSDSTAIIFDCDGVLVDTERVACRIDARELTANGLPMTPEMIASRFSGMNYRDMHRVLEAETGVRLPEGFARRTYEIVLAALENEGSALAIPGVHPLLDALGNRKKCIASSSTPEWLQKALRPVGLWQRFEPDIFSRVEVALGKPAPDLFLLAARRMGVAPTDCLVIEDSIAGVQAGKAAGMKVLGFCGGGHCGPGHGGRLLNEGAEAVFDRMDQVQEVLCGQESKSPLGA